MMPLLFEIELFGFPLSLPTYGAFLAIGFLCALIVALRQARAAGVESSVITDLWIVSLLAGVIGAKLLLYLLDVRYYFSNPAAIWATCRSAGVWYGGLILAVLACLIAVRRRGLDGWLMGDIAAPAIVLGQAIGRLGCFAAGCCFGAQCSRPWAITFTSAQAHEITGVPLGVPLHPTQLYHAIGNFLIFGILMVSATRKKFAGQVLLLYLLLYAATRGILEQFRGDPRGELLGMSTSQVISIGVGVVALWLYILRARRRAQESPGKRPRTASTG